MAYLFYSAGRQCEPGLTFALLGAGYAAHESTLTWWQAPTASKRGVAKELRAFGSGDLQWRLDGHNYRYSHIHL